MPIIEIIVYFFVFAFVGWILDSTYSSFMTKKIKSSGFIKGLPFCYIYGFGGIILMLIFSHTETKLWWQSILFGGVAMVALEYFGSVFCEVFFGRRLWNYSKMKYNLHGRVSLKHSFYWLLLTAILYFSSSMIFLPF